MHTNETFLTKLTTEQVVELLTEAEGLGKQYVAALKEQLTRVLG